MNESNNIEKWITLKEIQAHLGVDREAISRWTAERNIPAYRIGRLWKFRISGVGEWAHSGEAANKANSGKNKEA